MLDRDSRLLIEGYLNDLDVSSDSREYRVLMDIQNIDEEKMERILLFLASGDLSLNDLIKLGAITDYSINVFLNNFDADGNKVVSFMNYYEDTQGFSEFNARQHIAPRNYISQTISTDGLLLYDISDTVIAKYDDFHVYYREVMQNWQNLKDLKVVVQTAIDELKAAGGASLDWVMTRLDPIVNTPYFLNLPKTPYSIYATGSFMWTMTSGLVAASDCNPIVVKEALSNMTSEMAKQRGEVAVAECTMLIPSFASLYGWSSLNSQVDFHSRYSKISAYRIMVPRFFNTFTSDLSGYDIAAEEVLLDKVEAVFTAASEYVNAARSVIKYRVLEGFEDANS